MGSLDILGTAEIDLPGLTTIFHYDQLFADVEIGGSGSSTLGGSALIEFEDVSLDLGEFITDFLAPLIEQVAQVTEPLQPLVEILTDDIGLLVELGAPVTNILDIAGTILGKTKYAGVIKAIDAIVSIIDFINKIDAFVDSGADELKINFGSFTMGGDAGHQRDCDNE